MKKSHNTKPSKVVYGGKAFPQVLPNHALQKREICKGPDGTESKFM
jgi:hypothetical protein